MEVRHRALAEIALAAAGSYGLALAGGYAVRAHGIGSRPSGDVDLFTDWQRRADFPRAVDTVIAALEERGYAASVVTRGDTFARLLPERRATARTSSRTRSSCRRIGARIRP